MPDDKLEKEDVNTDSSSEDTDLDLGAEDDPDALEADEADGDEGEGEAPKKKERTVEQVKREFDRKFGKLSSKIDMLFDKLDSAPAEKPSKTTKSSLDDYSIEELRTMRGNLTDEAQRAQLDDYMVDRRIRDGVNAALKSHTTTQSFERMKQEAEAKAASRYPELKDRTSDFYMEVKDRIRSLGREYAERNPRAVLDVANDVAQDMGIAPQKIRRVRGTFAKRTDKSAPEEPKPKTAMSKETAERIAKNLQGALPRGKSFDINKIIADHGEFHKNKDLFVK